MVCSLRLLLASFSAHLVLAVMSVVHVAADSGAAVCGHVYETQCLGALVSPSPGLALP